MIPMRKSPEIQTKFGKCDDDFISNCTSAVIYELIILGAFFFSRIPRNSNIFKLNMTNNENLDFDKSDNAKSIHHIYFVCN